MSGQLEWSPTHKSELFWLDNASKLEENDLEILRYIYNNVRNAF
jgi:V-type H+-transporting ATPase subunit H